jgi:hypothetical protein
MPRTTGGLGRTAVTLRAGDLGRCRAEATVPGGAARRLPALELDSNLGPPDHRPEVRSPRVGLAHEQAEPPGSGWIVSLRYTKDGRRRVITVPVGMHSQQGSWIVNAGTQLCLTRSDGSPAQCLTQHGYTQVGQLPTRQPILALPMVRNRLAARAVNRTDRRHRVAGPCAGNLDHPN